MKILVTGGAGFIGSAVVRAAVRAGHAVINLDKLTYAGSLSNVAEVAGSPRYAFERADICDRSAVDRILARHRPDAILHFAAESHVDRSIQDSGPFVRTNVLGTQVLLDAAGGGALLVVGSRGHGGFSGLMLGSVSQQCVAHAPCPVVVVHVLGETER